MPLFLPGEAMKSVKMGGWCLYTFTVVRHSPVRWITMIIEHPIRQFVLPMGRLAGNLGEYKRSVSKVLQAPVTGVGYCLAHAGPFRHQWLVAQPG